MIKLHGKEFVPYIDAGQISQRVAEIAAMLTRDYKGKRPLFVPVLNGAFIFAADLVRAVQMETEISFVRFSSYRGMTSSGSVRETLGVEEEIAGRHLIIVEDILDTGKTLWSFRNQLQQETPASVRVVALLHKPGSLQYPVPVDYFGFEIPEQFVVGYGLDYDGLGRNLPDIYQLKK